MIYLASPYSHPDPTVRQERFEQACSCVAHFAERNEAVIYSPIVHSHAIVQAGHAPADLAFWMAHDLHMLRLAEKLFVLQIDGYRESVGVRIEIAAAEAMGTPVEYYPPPTN